MKNNHTPEIRFAVFTRDWEERKLGELCDEFQSGKNIKSEDIRDEGRYPVFGGNGFRGYTNTYNHDGLYALIGRQGALCGNMNISYGKAYFTEHAIAVKGNKNNETRFLFYLLGKMDLGQYSGQSAQPGLAVNKLKDLPAFIPTFAEQAQISEFFKKLDTLIALHQQELTTLKQTKQGFLQKMFPKEGESVPEVRFLGFSEEWEVQKFKDLAEVRRGLTYSPANIRDNGVRVLRSSNINEDTFVLRNDDVFVDPQAINIDFVKEYDILITSANGSSRLVGKHALIKNVGKDAVHGGFMLVATAKVPFFVNAMMGSVWYSKFINVYVSGGNGAIGNINKNALEEQTVLVPELEEQKKIGNFFKQLDDTITLHQRELDALKETKKAFLQKMFV
ncbi:restriction endonuclease subunit S [Bacillus mojavensis]|uniref:restriction endonuclease subunit S n=1 Tax=Bacillus mojavensis TaxID=72360 RepID=UPI002DBDCFFE|nr:restriction endonuclease subunit S [Bacillus mojavensis]MEC1625245.1 restriction endonuclease subunit S [Bacillus mojavensis]